MDVNIRTRNFNLSDAQETQIRKRIDRLPRHLENLEQSEILLSMEPTHYNSARFQFVAQITLKTRNNSVIRSEVTNAELLTAVDEATSHLSRQIERFKGRFYQKNKSKQGVGHSSAEIVTDHVIPTNTGPSPAALTEPLDMLETTAFSTGPLSEDDIGDIVRVKKFEVKPMQPEEAIEQMELLGHNFYVFYNSDANILNVLYRRTDGNYGLLQPEYN
ncbi:MAG: ribosome-associated translation inhibitor RaiA [Chloroflexia bacterium]